MGSLVLTNGNTILKGIVGYSTIGMAHNTATLAAAIHTIGYGASINHNCSAVKIHAIGYQRGGSNTTYITRCATCNS